MADDLRHLEREVEAARAKLASDLSTLRSPETFSDFADNLKQAAIDRKDTIIDDARTRTRSAIEDMVESVKAKAAANPASVLVIGTGLAWHLMRRPPIVAALVGGGLYSLLRTPAPPSLGREVDHMAVAKENLKNQAETLAAAASAKGREVAEVARAKAETLAESARERLTAQAEELKETAGELGQQAADFARGKAAAISDKAHALMDRGADPMQADPEPFIGAGTVVADALNQEADGRLLVPNGSGTALTGDKLLLGAAGMAVAAALAFAYRRRQYDRFPD